MQHKFPIPTTSLNSDTFRTDTGLDLYTRDGDLIISGEITKDKAQILLNEHTIKVTAQVEAAATQKAALLARLGITADEAKLLIG